MRKTIYKNKLFLILSMLLMVLLGCAEGKLHSYQQALMLLNEHQQELEQIVDFCEKNSAVRWIDQSSIDFYESGSASDGFGKQLNDVRDILTTVNAVSMACGRRGDIEGNPFSSISITIYSRGLGISGLGQSIVYFVNWASEDGAEMSEQELKENGLTRLDKPGWFFSETK